MHNHLVDSDWQHMLSHFKSRILRGSCSSFLFFIQLNMAGTKVSLISNIQTLTSYKDKSAKRYKRTCQIPYASFLSNLQRDSDEEEVLLEPGAKIVFPF